ncbi:D-alanyl-D-alanine-carboxypeptidase/endopeptidase AmpH [Chelativorans sp. YIM 93263]|uniref:D-alanyl-D-alanine- carboxypeptidase/endopeptidase AmpH n=1 Tax=Chelativorans sp. YIM 93263 TaxID=2906648 RepID=UPI002379AA3F|nr:D-alanyl-D-alanine-carboxypeptidase/endopeptidase AmpH [Chelativorans sp. YIM 93263]
MKKFLLLSVLAVCALTRPTAADERLLKETVEFTGAILFSSIDVPGLVIGATRNGETAIAGFGSVSDDSGQAPDGDTLMRIGSITKVFTGAALASMVADGQLGFSDRLEQHLEWDVAFPQKDGRPIKLIDLVTHTSGLPREIDVDFGPPDDPFKPHTREAYERNLDNADLYFAPGDGALYSNFAFNLISWALEDVSGQTFPDLLSERVLKPAGLSATNYAVDETADTLFQGHAPDGSPLPSIPTHPGIYGSGGLYSSANDMLHWLSWHMDRFSPTNAEMRLLDHAAYVSRDGLDPVLGMDESGHMDAMGLGWVIMHPEGDRPLILQKAGGMQGILSYAAFAPTRDVGVFVAINQFNFAAAMEMAPMVNELIAQLAPR